MKIIGDTGNGYLVEMSDYELGLVMGTPCKSRSYHGSIPAGKCIEIATAWKKLEPIIDGEKRIRQQADILRGLATVLDGSADLVKRAMEFTPPVPTQPSSEPK